MISSESRLLNSWAGLDSQNRYDKMASTLSFRHATSGTLTVNTLINGPLKATMLSDQFEKYAFVKRMESEPGFEEITTFPQRLSTPALLDVGRRTWIERTGKIAISVFCLDSSHTGYTDLVHGGILAALVDEGCAEFCNRGAVALYPLTKYLGVEFENPSPIGEVFIAKVSTSQLFPLTVNDSGEVWVKCEVSVLRGEDKVIQVVMANALFILCERLPKIPNCEEACRSIEDLFTYGGDEPARGVAPVGVPRGKWSVLVLISAALVAGFLVSCNDKTRAR
jgi:hypothetical protein